MDNKLDIQILYFEGCPNVEAARNLISDALDQAAISAKVSLVEVVDNDDAITKKFIGSPSFRINGEDIEQNGKTEETYSMRCRLYSAEDGLSGLPKQLTVVEQIKKHI